MSLYAALVACTALVALSACKETVQADDPGQAEFYAKKRLAMVGEQIAGRGIRSQRVLDAMKRVPRHRFIPELWRSGAYEDHPVPLGYDQTISQPFIVAFMTQAIDPQATDRVLEIGTGSGYQAAILAELVAEVYTIEIVQELGELAAETLKELGYQNVTVRIGDGYEGWTEMAPFDKVILTAAPPELPQPLLDQLKEGGLLIAPVGVESQDLILYRKTSDGITRDSVLPVRFVPMTGKAQG